MPKMTKKKAALVAAIAAIAAPAEGLRHYAYRDPPGILTVCYGHTGSDVKKGVKYSDEQCLALLKDDAADALADFDRCVPGAPDPVRIAFGDAIYNLGPTIACNTRKSTAARLLKAGDYVAACKQLPRWDKTRLAGMVIALPGLTKRRHAEMAKCLEIEHADVP